MRIGIVAPSAPLAAEAASRVSAIAADRFPGVELAFHDQCTLSYRHFAGEDRVRAQAFLAVANDPSIDVLWFARGGYGACRVAEPILAGLGAAARDKLYLGYSDAGFLLAGLYKAGFRVAHGPMPQDVLRAGGEQAIVRALGWLADGRAEALEPGLGAAPAAAFNLTVLSQLVGSPLEPDLAGHELLVEEVSEHMYRIDRALFHITSQPSIRRMAGLRLGRCSLIPDNDPDFGETEEEVVRYWCERAGLDYLGRADIGHDAANRIVPYGKRS